MREGMPLPPEAHPEARHEAESPRELSVGPSMANAEMYQLPDDEALTERDVARYAESRDRFEAQLGESVVRGLHAADLPTRLTSVGLIEHSSRKTAYESVHGILREGLADKDEWIRISALWQVPNEPLPFRGEMLRAGLDDVEDVVRYQAAEQWHCLPAAERTRFITDGLENPDPYVRVPLHSAIPALPIDERGKVIARMLDKGFSLVQAEVLREVIASAADIDEPSRVRIAETALTSTSRDAREAALVLLPSLPDADRARLEEAYARQVEGDLLVDRPANGTGAVLPKLETVAEPHRDRLKQLVLAEAASLFGESELSLRLHAVELLQTLPLEERASLLAETRKAVADGLKSGDVRTEFFVSTLIALLPEADRTTMIELVFSSGRPTDGERVMRVYSGLPEADRRRLFESYPEMFRKLQDAAMQMPLYLVKDEKTGKKRDDFTPFLSRKFEKSGSGLTLLDIVPGDPDNSLRGRVVIRHLEGAPYLEWRKAYEAADFWKEKGFDQVPIEPIVKAEERNGVYADVFTRVLPGLSLREWRSAHGPFADEMAKEHETIVAGLKELGIDHNHPHEGNSVVVFERDEDGQPLLWKKPRLYMIDFDRARPVAKLETAP